MSTTKHCPDCGKVLPDHRAARCRPCSVRHIHALPSAFRFAGTPTLRDYPGQPALSGGYTSSELATLQALICTRGPWTPARWAWDTPVPRDTGPAA